MPSKISKAQAARAEKHLDKMVSVGGVAMTNREFMDDLRRQGGKLILDRERDYDGEDRLKDKIWRMGARVPIGNPNHPETIEYYELKEKLKNGLYKERLMIETPGGRFYEVTKTEADYFERAR